MISMDLMILILLQIITVLENSTLEFGRILPILEIQSRGIIKK